MGETPPPFSAESTAGRATSREPLTVTERGIPQIERRAAAFRRLLSTRRSVRDFDPDRIPTRRTIEQLIRAEGSSPSGANRQPWSFVVVRDPAMKRRIRSAAEAEERRNYTSRMGAQMKAAVRHLGTTWEKPHIEDAPYLIVVFRQAWGYRTECGQTIRLKHFYGVESVGIAVGTLICAIHYAGLVTLPHTPSPMRFLSRILNRPANERAYLLMPVGFPKPLATVPRIQRKPLDEVLIWADEPT